MVIRLPGKDVEVDDEMIPVIEDLNHLGLKTTGCCQGHPTKTGFSEAYIGFSISDVSVLLNKGQLLLCWKRVPTQT